MPVPAGARDRGRAFQRSVLAPGWHHIFDGLVQRGLNSLTWFPSYLASLKVLLAFLRNHMHDIEQNLASEGTEAAADFMRSVSFPSFAHWRWSTLNCVVRAVSNVYTIFKENVDRLRFVAKMRNKSVLKSIRASLADPTFQARTDFVLWYSDWLCDIERWGGGCHCHFCTNPLG